MASPDYQRGDNSVFAYNKPFESVCNSWESPTVIISDGAYGVGGFEGDCKRPDGLKEWYKPFVEMWSDIALPSTTLWFWNTEVGWANVHHLLEENGWKYVHTNTWDKGKSHIAGNVNTKTIRHFPVATELCVQYVRATEYRLNTIDSDNVTLQDWMRSEWKRSGLSFKEANRACGVANAASRKYLTADYLWYMPPPDAMQMLVSYANEHGDPSGKPYFVMDDKVVTKDKWASIRAVFNCPYGIYNVWHTPSVRGTERLKDNAGDFIHPNQKPLSLMERIIKASSNKGDAVWDVFGGVMTGALASVKLERRCFTSEINPVYFDAGIDRLRRI